MPSSQTALVKQFEDTGETVKLGERTRPVLRLGKRLFAGEFLSVLNPHGYGGRVWSATDIDQLQYNINFARGEWGKSLS